ncbi:hypothetical protein [Desulfosporosinus nitroreducens]|uniref:hypothetical protein n=1 Tax=Desulfosporosinus nitroreducens TaxID=2018668 RepID=UPI00207D2E68|nr:hypothetical protein [Desulfosporosinus nitroreducens]MCO1602624.1 hypothetical protein [Desulfosporosinus nitroreducens]
MNPVLNQISLNLEHRQDSSGMVEIKTPPGLNQGWTRLEHRHGWQGVVLARDRKIDLCREKRVKLPLVEK